MRNPEQVIEAGYCEIREELLAALRGAATDPAPSEAFDLEEARYIIDAAIEAIEADELPARPVEGWEYWTGAGRMFGDYALWLDAMRKMELI